MGFKLYFKEGKIHGTELVGEEVLPLNEELRHMGWSEQNGLSEKDKYHRCLDLQLPRYTLVSGRMSCIQFFPHPFVPEGSESMTILDIFHQINRDPGNKNSEMLSQAEFALDHPRP